MARTPFISARLKIERAHRHISEFISFLDHTAQKDFTRAIIEPNEDMTVFTLKIEVDSIPAGFSLIIGDAVHCLRSSLDHVATQIVWEATGSNKRIHFPMHETRDNLVDMAQKSPVNDAFPEFEGLILETINPCKAGNAPLWLAGKLNNIDKHNEIVVVVGATDLWLEKISDENQNVFYGLTVGLKNGTFANPIVAGSPMQIEGEIKPSLDILFGPILDINGLSVIRVLDAMFKATTNAVYTIEAEYLK